MPDIEPTPPRAGLIYDKANSMDDGFGELDLTTWDDVEISDSRQVGPTRFTRGVIHGETEEKIWAEYDFGEGMRNTEVVTNSQELSSKGVDNVWNALTGPQAPTDLDEQISHGDTVVLAERAAELKTHEPENELSGKHVTAAPKAAGPRAAAATATSTTVTPGATPAPGPQAAPSPPTTSTTPTHTHRR